MPIKNIIVGFAVVFYTIFIAIISYQAGIVDMENKYYKAEKKANKQIQQDNVDYAKYAYDAYQNIANNNARFATILQGVNANENTIDNINVPAKWVHFCTNCTDEANNTRKLIIAH